MEKLNDILAILFNLFTMYFINCGRIDWATFSMVGCVLVELRRKESK